MSPVQQTLAPLLWFLSAVLKHVQASGRSKDALSDQTQSVDPPHFQTDSGANAHCAACTKPETRTTRPGCGNKPRTLPRTSGLAGGGFARAEMAEKLKRCQVRSPVIRVFTDRFCFWDLDLMCRAGCGSYQVVVLVISEEGNPSFLTTAQLRRNTAI